MGYCVPFVPWSQIALSAIVELSTIPAQHPILLYIKRVQGIQLMKRTPLTKEQILSILARCTTGNQMISSLDNLKFNGFIK